MSRPEPTNDTARRVGDAIDAQAVQIMERYSFTAADALALAELQWTGALNAASGSFEFALAIYATTFEETTDAVR